MDDAKRLHQEIDKMREDLNRYKNHRIERIRLALEDNERNIRNGLKIQDQLQEFETLLSGDKLLTTVFELQRQLQKLQERSEVQEARIRTLEQEVEEFRKVMA